jgi:transposase InsO family protein
MGKGRAVVGLARYVVDAVLLEGASARDVARAHGISKSWIYELIGRYRQGGYEALEPRSRRPRSCKHATPEEVVQAIISLRERLASEGHDCGSATIAYHLALEIEAERVPSLSTIWRLLRREGLIVPQPQKKPRCALIRFQAQLPNEMWQTDITHWQLSSGEHVEIMNMIDDHSRLFLASQALRTIKAHDVVEVFHKASQLHGLPASLLSDNGAVFTGASRKGKVLLETELERLGIEFKNSRPYHPQTCGKIERLHQTLKRYLARQKPARTLQELQEQLDTFAHYYNTMRPAQSAARPHTTTGLQHPHQGQTSQPDDHSTNPLQGPPRQGRQPRQSHAAPRKPPTPHRHRQSPQGTTNQAPDRRPKHPHHRPANRRATTRPHARPNPRLPTPPTSRKPSIMTRDIRPGCPETQHYSGGGIRTRDLRVMSPTSYQTAPPRGGLSLCSSRQPP